MLIKSSAIRNVFLVLFLGFFMSHAHARCGCHGSPLLPTFITQPEEIDIIFPIPDSVLTDLSFVTEFFPNTSLFFLTSIVTPSGRTIQGDPEIQPIIDINPPEVGTYKVIFTCINNPNTKVYLVVRTFVNGRPGPSLVATPSPSQIMVGAQIEYEINIVPN